MLGKVAPFLITSKLLGLSRNFSSKVNVPKVCVIGSGPAGFYVAQHLIKVNALICTWPCMHRN